MNVLKHSYYLIIKWQYDNTYTDFTYIHNAFFPAVQLASFLLTLLLLWVKSFLNKIKSNINYMQIPLKVMPHLLIS
jgi:hypothetical protein